MKLTEQSCAEFSELLSAKVSVPGGGGAAAYIGALAAALGAMAAQFTTGKKKFAAYEADLSRIIEESESLRRRFLALVEEDAAAFEPLSRAYGIPKEDPAREETLREATLAAARVPYACMEACCETAAFLEEMAQKCSALMISDVGCAAAALSGALSSAALNVFVNTRTLPEDKEAALLAQGARRMLSECGEKSQRLYQEILGRLDGVR